MLALNDELKCVHAALYLTGILLSNDGMQMLCFLPFARLFDAQALALGECAAAPSHTGAASTLVHPSVFVAQDAAVRGIRCHARVAPVLV